MNTITTFAQDQVKLTLSSGFVFGLAPGTDRFVTRIAGWHSGAKMRRNSSPRMQQHGNFTEPGYRDARYPSVSGHYVAPGRRQAQAFVDEINAYLGDGGEGVLEVIDADGDTRWAEVLLIGCDVRWNGERDVAFDLDMEAPDPRKYGQPTTASTGVAREAGGLRFDLFSGLNGGTANVLSFGPAGALGTITLRNLGKAEVYPTFRVQGHTPGFTIVERETQRRLVYSGLVGFGQTLYLNGADGSVRLEGYADRLVNLIRSEWPSIPGGSSRSYLFESTNGPDAKLIGTVTPAWW